jgi:hypothetical protein
MFLPLQLCEHTTTLVRLCYTRHTASHTCGGSDGKYGVRSDCLLRTPKSTLHIPEILSLRRERETWACTYLVGDERRFLKRSADNRLGIELQPVFQNGGIDPPEVLVGHQIAL